MTTIYQGSTLQLTEVFRAASGESLQVDSAVFALEDPNGIVITVAAVLAADRKSASASYDMPTDAVAGTWTWVCQTGGSGRRHYLRHVLTVLERPVVATPPAEPYWARVYYGVGAATVDTAAEVEALGHTDLGGTKDFEAEVSPDDEYVFWAVPADWSIETELDGSTPAEAATVALELHGYDGTMQDYVVHRTEATVSGEDLALVVTEAE